MTTADPQFDGMYGPFTITSTDREEVQRYRICLLVSGLSLSVGLLQWWLLGGQWAWLWLLPLSVSLGLSLHWIHIYLRPLHRALQLFWLLGCLGWLVLMLQTSTHEALDTLTSQPLWILAVGPMFAALTGIGFKEFFCFRRAEAVGLTLLLPVALLGRLLGLVGNGPCGMLVLVAGLLLVVLALRKFGMEAAADVGDKSVFAYLDAQREVAGS
tara:strand:- start:119 stop:757 length:639 start_codon:yes stop_codon:yes gene_type:complete